MTYTFTPVDHDSAVPAAAQVVTAITAAVRDRRLRPGAQLPSYAVLAAGYGVTQSVITEALRRLKRAGVIERGFGGPAISLEQSY